MSFLKEVWAGTYSRWMLIGTLVCALGATSLVSWTCLNGTDDDCRRVITSAVIGVAVGLIAGQAVSPRR